MLHYLEPSTCFCLHAFFVRFFLPFASLTLAFGSPLRVTRRVTRRVARCYTSGDQGSATADVRATQCFSG